MHRCEIVQEAVHYWNAERFRKSFERQGNMIGWTLMTVWSSGLVLAAEQPGVNPLWQMAPFIIIAATFVFMVWLPNSRDQRRRQEALTQLKKNDRVYTSSGIIGTVANISGDGKEVTLKIDDNEIGRAHV